MPLLTLFGYQLAFANRHNILFVVKIIGIASEEVKEQVPKSLRIPVAITPKLVNVVIESGGLAICIESSQVWFLMQRRQYRGIPRL